MKRSKFLARLVYCLAGLAFAFAAGALETTHKIQVNDPALARQILAQGGRLIADYGGYQLFEAAAINPALEASGQAAMIDEYNFILLNAKHLDTTSPDIQALRTAVGNFQGKRLHLV